MCERFVVRYDGDGRGPAETGWTAEPAYAQTVRDALTDEVMPEGVHVVLRLFLKTGEPHSLGVWPNRMGCISFDCDPERGVEAEIRLVRQILQHLEGGADGAEAIRAMEREGTVRFVS